MLNSRILGLIRRGRAYFVVNETTIFLPGEWRLIEERVAERGRPISGAKLRTPASVEQARAGGRGSADLHHIYVALRS